MKTRTVTLLLLATVVIAGSIGFLGSRWLSDNETEPHETAPSSPSPQPLESEAPDAQGVDPSDLARPRARVTKTLYGNLDATGTDEIVIVSRGRKIPDIDLHQVYVQVFSWDGTEWAEIFDAAETAPRPGVDPLVPEWKPGDDWQVVEMVRVIDFESDLAPELVLAFYYVGASSGPMNIWVFSGASDGLVTEFDYATVRGGSIEVRADELELETGNYDPDDAMCCPSALETIVIGSTGSGVGILSREKVPTIDGASLAINGFGPIRVGMTLDEASTSARREITITYDSGRGCAYAEPRGGPEGLRFMVIDGEIVRIDIDSPSLTTLSGIHNGSTEADVYDAYPGRIRREGHPYDQGGSYLIYEPKDASDQEYLMIFETDGTIVTRFRSGFKQPVFFIEGCS